MAGDGNCMFRSISHELWGTPRFHPNIRRKAVRWMKCASLFVTQWSLCWCSAAWTVRGSLGLLQSCVIHSQGTSKESHSDRVLLLLLSLCRCDIYTLMAANRVAAGTMQTTLRRSSVRASRAMRRRWGGRAPGAMSSRWCGQLKVVRTHEVGLRCHCDSALEPHVVNEADAWTVPLLIRAGSRSNAWAPAASVMVGA